MLLRRNSIQNLFNGYDFDIEQLRHQIQQDKRRQEIEDENQKNRLLTNQINTTQGGGD
jgi:hypothetical protein